MNKVASVIKNSNGAGGDPHRVMFTENHDMASNQNHGRIPAMVNPGGSPYKPNYCNFCLIATSNSRLGAQKKAMLGLGVILSSPVFPMLFYGQEMLSYATFNFPSPPAIDWNLPTANSGLVQVPVLSIHLRSQL
jgi:hypothetical protein